MICQQVTLSGDAEWPKVADAVIEAFTCTVGLLSGFGTWDGTSVHDPHIHDPGIQYEPVRYVDNARPRA